jgi:predicted AlkP superfamily phosphohydrolase/phosphomutase
MSRSSILSPIGAPVSGSGLFVFLLLSLLACDPAPKGCAAGPAKDAPSVEPHGATVPPSTVGDDAAGKPRVLLIGMDGADMRWIDRLAGAGRLPNFARLIERGVAGSLETVHFQSPIIWTTVATGVQPSRHGIRGFTARVKPDGTGNSHKQLPSAKSTGDAPAQDLPKTQVLPSGRERPASVADRTRPAFWNILSHYEKSVGVLAWWATYPAESVNGYMLSPYLIFGVPTRPGTATVNVDWTDEDAAKAFPAELGNEVSPMMYKASEIDRERHASVLGVGGQTPYTPWGLARDRSYYEAALHTMKTRPVDCVAVYFQGPDVASHDFTYFAYGQNVNQKRAPRVEEKAVVAGLKRVEAMYEYMDEILGGLLAAVGPETNVIILSDHGWEYDGTSHWNLNPGIFVAAGPSIRKGQRVEGVSVLDITPILLAILDVPLAKAFDGVVPEGVLEPEVTSRLTYVDDYPIPAVSLAVARSDEAVAEEEKMMELLRALGYIE